MMDRHMEEDSSTFLQWAMNHLQHPAAATAVSAAYQQEGGAGVGVRISGGAGDQEDSAAAFPSLQALRASQPQVVPGSVRVRDLTVQVADYGGLTNSSSSGDSPGAASGRPRRRHRRAAGRPGGGREGATTCCVVCGEERGRRGPIRCCCAGIVAGAGAGPHHRRAAAQGEDQPALYRALNRHPRPQKGYYR